MHSTLLSVVVISLILLLGSIGCSSSTSAAKPAAHTYTLVLHGGAGTMDPTAPESEKQAYRESLTKALTAGRDILAKGGSALDAVQAVVVILEDDEKFNAGKGAVYNAAGNHELDASIMDGSTMACGAVAGTRTIKNPIRLARLVMERSGHVMLISDGAEQFADAIGAEYGIERVPNSYFNTERRWQQLQKKLEERRKFDPLFSKSRGTVGAVALDSKGNLAAATSTGGLSAKRFGRVGDSPIIGAGTYANKKVAVSCTGTGEEFIRFGVAKDVASRYEYQGLTLNQAADHLIFKTLQPDDGGLIAVSHTGEIATPYSSPGMYRGIATSSGRFEVKIFKDE